MIKSGEEVLLAFFGHHKGATIWISNIINEICYELRLKYVTVHNPEMFNYDLREFVEKEKINFLAYVNADYEYIKHLPNLRGFHVIRDPRDISVSAYFSHLYSHSTEEWPGLIEHRKRLQNLEKDQGLLVEMEFRKDQFKSMYEWNYSLPQVLEVKMEDLIKNPYQGFVDIFHFLRLLDDTHFGIKKRLGHLFAISIPRSHYFNYFVTSFLLNKLPVERLLDIVHRNNFTKKSGGRKPGQEDIKNHYRKGISGDWKNHFTEEHIAFFKSNYNDILLKLGYEQDPDWQ